MRQYLLLAATVLSVLFSAAQPDTSSIILKWSKAHDSLTTGLPPSVQLFYTNDSLEGKPFIAYCLVADLKAKDIAFTTQVGNGKRFTPSQFYESEKQPLVVVNGTFFSFQTNQNLNLIIRDGRLKAQNVTTLKGRGKDSTQYYYVTRGAIGINKRRKADVAWIFTDSSQSHAYAFEDSPVVAKGASPSPRIRSLKRFDYQKWRMQTAIGGGPVLIHDGAIRVTNRQEQMFVGGEKDKHPRTAMGYSYDGKFIILAIQGRTPGIAEGATMRQEAQIMYGLGCYEALNLDGGGSSCLLVNGKETIKPSDATGQRPVPGVFLIKKS